MSAPRRLSICYVVPGHSSCDRRTDPQRAQSRPGARPVGGRDGAFRLAIDAQDRTTFAWSRSRLIALERAHGRRCRRTGRRLCRVPHYLRQLRRFAAERLLSYDVVLEKSWLLSGYLSSYCRRHGVLGVPVENVVPNPGHVARGNLTKLARLQVGRWLAGRYLRQAPLIIAETEFLKADIAANWRVAPERIAVVDLGVDRRCFDRSIRLPRGAALGSPRTRRCSFTSACSTTFTISARCSKPCAMAGPDDRAPPGRGRPLCRPLPREGRRRRERRLPRPRGALSGARADRRCRPLRRPL